MKNSFLLGGALAAMAMVAACAQTDQVSVPADALLVGDSFVPIARSTDSATASLRRAKLGVNAGAIMQPGNGDDFYLAISKKELGKRWFLSGFLTQYYPGQVDLGAARSLGTRVVSFKVQNGKLFVFDVADNKASSDLFDPTVLVEAYPIVTGYAPFEGLANHDNYVLFDPSAGMNKFQVAGDLYNDWYLGNAAGATFSIGVSFMQSFRKISDGVTYEQVFTGNGVYNDVTGPVEYRASGTVSVGLRKYSEGDGYTPTAYPATGNYFFASDWKLVPNSGGGTYSALHWNLQPGKPITYYITPSIQACDQMYPNAHIIDAVKAGVTNWNQVFGFEALKAEVAKDNSVMGEDDKNVIEYDPDPSVGYAFANWRSNPNTGEIRGATVYLGGVWCDESPFQNQTASSGSGNLTPPPKAPQRVAGPAIMWAPLNEKPACLMWAPKYRVDGAAATAGVTGSGAGTAQTPDQMLHDYITSVVLHEVGHTLGLRHNFKGSLTPPSTSVMDYLTDSDSIATPVPQAYDIEAIHYLYGMAGNEPDLAFCTDEDVVADPDCTMFDSGADPLKDSWGNVYNELLGLVEQVGWGSFFDGYVDYYLNGVLGYARAGASDDIALAAYKMAMGPAAPPADPTVLAMDGGAAFVDGLAARVLQRLYLAGPDARGYIANDPTSPSVNEAALRDLQNILDNSDGVRTFDTRRSVVDILKKMQTEEAYAVLRGARSDISATEASLAPEAQALTDDLLARIDAATSPYFNH